MADEPKADPTAPAEASNPPEEGGAQGEGQGEGDGDGEAKPEEPQLRMFVFDDEKKKKKGKKAKVKPPKRPTKQEYEMKIADLHAILSELRQRAIDLDRINLENNQKLVEAHEMDRDVSEHLSRVQKKRLDVIKMEETYQLEIIKKRKDLEIESKERMAELQKEYAQVEKQFLGEIDMLTYKFRSLCQFFETGDETLENMSNIENEYKQCETQFQDSMYEIQKLNVVKRKNTDEEAKGRFHRIINDFSESREVRNAAYTRRLLSENNDLRKKYNQLIPRYLKKEGNLTKILEKTQVVKEKHMVLTDMIKQLESTQAKRDELLRKLKSSYNFYKLQVVRGSKYRRMFEAVKEHQRKESAKYQDEQVLHDDIVKHTNALHEKYRVLKETENMYLIQRQQYDMFVEAVRNAAFSLCHLDEYQHMFPKTFDEYIAKRNGIIRGLIELIMNVERSPLQEAVDEAKYQIGYLGFMPLEIVMDKVSNSSEGSMDIVSKETSDPALECVKESDKTQRKFNI